MSEDVKEQDSDELEDGWEEFRHEDNDPIGIEALNQLDLAAMPEDVSVWVMDNYFPDSRIRREGNSLICAIEEHLYTKYWEHKFSAYAFSEAMERAITRLMHEGHPLSYPSRDAEDVHIFVRWQLCVPLTTPPAELVSS